MKKKSFVNYMNFPHFEMPNLRDIQPRMPNLRDLLPRIPNVVQPRPNQRQRPTSRQRRRWRRNQGRGRRPVLVDRRVTNVYPTYDNGYVDEPRPFYENPQLWIILLLFVIGLGIWMRRK